VFVRPILGAVLSLAALAAFAHSESEDAGYRMLDCEHPAEGVAKALPDPVSGPAFLQCTPAFQQIVANEGWSWRYPGSYFERPFIPAYAPTSSRGMGGARYFTGFEAHELDPADVRSEHERFAKSVPTYREAAPPPRILKVVATNDLGHGVDAYFGFRSERDGWVVMCAPDCAPESMFLFEKID
jgi:hypothetical protein